MSNCNKYNYIHLYKKHVFILFLPVSSMVSKRNENDSP